MLLKTQGVVRLATDVTVRYSQGGSAIASFSIVSSEKYKTQSGEQKENTTFIDATAFGRLGEICNQYLKKGSQVYIDGRLKLDQWTAPDGTNRSKHSVIVENLQMIGSKQDKQETTGYDMEVERPQPAQHDAPLPEFDIDEDSIPF